MSEFDYRTIKSYEDACAHLNRDPNNLPSVEGLEVEEAEALLAQHKLWVIARAIRNGWKPNWKDSNEWKYYPWFDMNPDEDDADDEDDEQDAEKVEGQGASVPGGGFSSFDCDFVSSLSIVGSRLCFSTGAEAQFFGETFLELHRQVHVLNY